MDTFSKDALNLALNEFADIDAVACTQFDEGLVPLVVELRPDILSFEGHLGDDLIAEILGEFLDVLDARVFDFLARDLADRAERHLRIPRDNLPLIARM